ncbi:serine/threonine-protein kinase Ptk2p/STK2 [Diutina catenulata]
MADKEKKGGPVEVPSSDSPKPRHHRFKKLFHRDKDSASSSKATSPVNHPGSAPKRTMSHVTRTASDPTLVSRTRSNSDLSSSKHHHLLHHHHPQVPPREMKKFSKAETLAQMNAVKEKNAKQAQIRKQNPTAAGPHVDQKIVYNPMGFGQNSNYPSARNTGYGMGGPGDSERVLAHPVADPNEHLPQDLEQPHSNLFDEWEIDMTRPKLGDGGSSDVRIVNAIGHKKKVYALKKFTLFAKETDEEFYKRALKEYVIAKRVGGSRHVLDTVALVRVHSIHNLTRGWGVVTELCSGGDLFNMIVSNKWKYTPLVEKFCLFKQIAYGVQFLHDNDVVHRDLKPENVLLDANGVCKLCDFGVSDFGHVEPGNMASELKLQTTYVGSPPYSPPEVMLLKDKKDSEAKNFAYDPFAMDMWGLGMLFFCIVYGGVPFQQAIGGDSQYRDWKFSFDRFASDHCNFKFNKGFPKGPGADFKWAQHFQSQGASRVAWKLCDPNVRYRYTMEMLFADPWFHTAEMCLYEDPDQLVNPFVLPGTGTGLSNSSSVSTQSSRMPSRRPTANGISASSTQQEPVRSMLDPEPQHPKSMLDPEAQANTVPSAHSTRSASSLTYSNPHNEHVPEQVSDAELPPVREVPTTTQEDDPQRPIPGNVPTPIDSPQVDGSARESPAKAPEGIVTPVGESESSEPSTPSALPPSELAPVSEQEALQSPSDFTQSKRIPSSASMSSTSPRVLPQRSSFNSIPRQKSDVDLIMIEEHASRHQLKPCEDYVVDNQGMCDLGYKIKKHHHV